MAEPGPTILKHSSMLFVLIFKKMANQNYVSNKYDLLIEYFWNRSTYTILASLMFVHPWYKTMNFTHA